MSNVGRTYHIKFPAVIQLRLVSRIAEQPLLLKPLNPAAIHSTNATAAVSADKTRIASADVREALTHDDALAEAVQHIILREDGTKLVIRGTVNSKELREKIADRVESLAKGWDVENELNVKSASE